MSNGFSLSQSAPFSYGNHHQALPTITNYKLTKSWVGSYSQATVYLCGKDSKTWFFKLWKTITTLHCLKLKNKVCGRRQVCLFSQIVCTNNINCLQWQTRWICTSLLHTYDLGVGANNTYFTWVVLSFMVIAPPECFPSIPPLTLWGAKPSEESKSLDPLISSLPLEPFFSPLLSPSLPFWGEVTPDWEASCAGSLLAGNLTTPWKQGGGGGCERGGGGGGGGLGRGGGRGGGRAPGGPDSWEMGECAGPHKHSCHSHSCISYIQKYKSMSTHYRDRLHNLLDIGPTVILFHF